MPREIADSDDEELVVIKPKSKRCGYDGQSDSADSAAAANTGTQIDGELDSETSKTDAIDIHELPGYGIDFITPTQRLSSVVNGIEDGEHTSDLIDSSTNRFLDEIVEMAQSSMEHEATGGSSKGKKRGSEEMEGPKSSSTKRLKTYGSNSTTKPVSVSKAQSDFLDMIQPASRTNSTEISNMVSVEPRSHYSSTGSASTATRNASGYAPPQPYTPQQNFGKMQGMTASRSSIGNYQSFTIDSVHLNRDFTEINPFGSLSQVSNAADLETEETRGISEVFKREKSTSQIECKPDTIDEMKTSPHEVMQPPEEFQPFEEPPKASPPYSPISDAEAINTISVDVPALPPPATTEELMPAPKKRGRKPKAKPAVLDDMDELQMDEHLATRSIRADTVDSDISELSHITSTSRTSKRSKKTKLPPREPESKKLPSSDLDLDNKAVIGLSPERYVPRPSRRRGKSEPEPQSELATAETPAKSKRGRKPKAKKGKAQVREDESEVIELTAKRAAIEEDQFSVDQLQEDTPTEDSPKGRRQPNISIDVPVLPRADEDNDEPVAPEPKKRGRKRKQPAEEPAVALVEEDAVLETTATTFDDTKVAEEKEDMSKDEDKENSSAISIKPDNRPLNGNSLATPAKPASPVKPLSTGTLFNQRARIGLSKRHSIPSLLSKINRNKEAPKVIEKKEKLNKRQLEEREQERIAKEEAEAEGREYVPLDILRNKDGSLVEWDF